MRKVLPVILSLTWLIAGAARAAEAPPPWAYGFKEAGGATAARPTQASTGSNNAADTRLYSVAGSSLKLTRMQISDPFGPADWFPGDHPQMPAIVAQGRKPAVMACALCHYPNGNGRPDSAPLAGLTVNHFIAQLQAFRNGTRKPADPRKTDTQTMAAIAKAMTDAEMREAAEYYSRLKPTPWIKVVEAKTVPETRIVDGLFLPVAGGKQEPIGARIVEIPEDADAASVLRNPRAGFIAYVPTGMINRGAVLAITGRGKTAPCSTCHAPDLKGNEGAPGIAGRSPSYLMRQMVDMRDGTRTGPGAELMKPVVGKMSNTDLMSLAAYVASRSP